MNELTNKTKVVVTRSLGNFYVTEDQAKRVERSMSDKTSIIKIDGNVIASNDIAGVVEGEAIRNLDRKKHGDWLCETHNNWIPKGKSCGYCGR